MARPYESAFALNVLGTSSTISERFRALFRVEPTRQKWGQNVSPYQRTANIGPIYCKAPTYPGAHMRYHRNISCSGMHSAKGPYQIYQYCSICFTDADVAEFETATISELEARTNANVTHRSNESERKRIAHALKITRKAQMRAHAAAMQRQAEDDLNLPRADGHGCQKRPTRNHSPPNARSPTHAKKRNAR